MARQSPKPNILFILVDDLGWAQVGYHSTLPSLTPAIDALAREGVILERHYCHKFCAPSRAAIQSGRAPIHVNVVNAPPVLHNPDDPLGGFAGIPRNMTGLGSLLSRAGYATHFVGKWDAGMATTEHTPRGRGYDTALCYFRHQNDYWKFSYGSCHGEPIRDLWSSEGSVDGPASALLNRPGCSETNQSGRNDFAREPEGGCVYEDILFERRVARLLEQHTTTAARAAAAAVAPPPPLFVFWSTHLVHGPYQAPREVFRRTHGHAPKGGSSAEAHVYNEAAYQAALRSPEPLPPTDLERAMVATLDGCIARVVQTLKRAPKTPSAAAGGALWDSTLVVFASAPGCTQASDNGGGAGSISNLPLAGWVTRHPAGWAEAGGPCALLCQEPLCRLAGGKHTNYEGGVRTAAFVSGGFVAPMRGATRDGLLACWDWYATLARLAGVDAHDARAAAVGLPPVDSIDVWPLVSGAASDSPRTSLALGTTAVEVASVFGGGGGGGGGGASVASAPAKWGRAQVGALIQPPWKLLLGDGPNYTTVCRFRTCAPVPQCAPSVASGCLFHIYDDPAEASNVATQHPAVFRRMLREMQVLQRTVYDPDRGRPANARACAAAQARGGFWGPFVT